VQLSLLRSIRLSIDYENEINGASIKVPVGSDYWHNDNVCNLDFIGGTAFVAPKHKVKIAFVAAIIIISPMLYFPLED